MNYNEHLLTILGEEGVEIAHRVSKAKRFGLDEVQPGQGLANSQRVMEEVDDLIAAVQMCQERGLLPASDPARIEAKKAKILHFLAYSAQVGTLQE